MKRARVRPQELARFTKQLATLLEVGFPPSEMIRILQAQGTSLPLRDAVGRVAEAIHEGDSLSTGMSLSPTVFDPLFINLVRAGEVSGRLPHTLKRLTSYLERTAALRREVVSALTYPLCVITTAAAVSSLLLVFIIPSFKDLFADLETPLPWMTRCVIVASETILMMAPYLSFAFVTLTVILSRFLKTKRGKKYFDTIALSVPLWGGIIRDTAIARAWRTLATTLDAGVPIVMALELSAQSAGNTTIERAIQRARLSVAEGTTISHSLSSTKLFPSLTIEMLEMGERTGSLDTTLENISNHLEEEVARSISTLKLLTEPVLIITLGVVVGTLVVAMYLPIFSMGELFT